MVTKVILAEAWVLGLTTVLLFAHALWVQWYETHYGPRLTRAQAFLTRTLDADEGAEANPDPQADDSINTLARLPARLQVRVFLALARNLSGRQKKVVGDHAVHAGLAARVERRLRSPWWWRRLHAARLLAALDVGGEALPRLLTDPHSRVRAQAAEWAGGHPQPEMILPLLRLLKDPAKLCRFTAQNSLLRMGGFPVAFISHYILRESGPGLEAALEVAQGLAEPQLLGAALKMCKHHSPAVQALAAKLLGQIGGKVGAAVLTDLLGHPEAAVRAAAARALGKLGEWPSAPALARALLDSAWDVRLAAGMGLRSLGSPGILLLRRSLTDHDKFAREMARQVLEIPASALARAVS